MAEKKYKAVFFGTPDFAVPSLEALFSIPNLEVTGVVTQPDRPAGRNRHIYPPPVKNAAQKHGVRIFQPGQKELHQFSPVLKSLEPDVIVLTAYGEMISGQLLNIPHHGWINVHASLLPKLRGASPIQHAVLEGFMETGVTLMKIVEKLDAGPIVSQESLVLKPRETAATLHDKLAKLGAVALSRSLLPFLEGTISPQEQDHQKATFCKKLSRADGIIDWSKSTEETDRKIRAFTPWPGAHTKLGKAVIKIITATPSHSATSERHGILSVVGSELIASTGSGSLRIDCIQPEGKKPMAGKEFIHGYQAILPASLQ